jgi:hypothetical protein
MNNKPALTISVFIFTILMLLAFSSCKDSSATSDSGKLEECKILIDESNWGKAIEACEDASGDEGMHLAAQAYLKRAGLSLFSLISTVTQSGSTSTSAAMLSFVPDTTADAADYKAALDAINLVEEKTQTMYLETLLVSSMLVFKEFKALLDLSVIDGSISTCAGTPPSPENCDFAPQITERGTAPLILPDKLVFSGLGSDFYTNLCGSVNDPTHDGLFTTDLTSDTEIPTSTTDPKEKYVVKLTFDVTVDSCDIQTGSVLYYNKIANENITGFGDLTGLDLLNYTENMDSGENFTHTLAEATGDTPAKTISFCNEGYIDLPASSDGKINDCEMLHYFMNSSF